VKAGEGREWDRGKVVDEESGEVGFGFGFGTEDSFGRLKGT